MSLMERHKPGVKWSLDLACWLLATPLAFWIRLEGDTLLYTRDIAFFMLVGSLLKGGTIWRLGWHRQVWTQVSLNELGRLLIGVSLITVLYTALGFFLGGILFLPRSIPLIEAMVAVILLVSLRVGVRVYFEQRWRFRHRGKRPTRRVLIIGAGDAGGMIAREMLRNPMAGSNPVGFLDDDPAKHGQYIFGIPVLGALDALPTMIRRLEADEVLIAMPSRGGEVVRRVIKSTRQAGVKHRIIPSMPALISGQVSIAEIREVDLDDLLSRDPIQLEPTGVRRYIVGRTVLVTGAGGSIGSEIVRQVNRFEPACVLLLGRGENSIYRIHQECLETWDNITFVPIIADVRDYDKLAYVFERNLPDVVFHAAAHKHVPLMEANPDEAILNNVMGTNNMVKLSLAHGVRRFVYISTDKAVCPSSIMGASKRVGEYLVEWGSRRANAGQYFVSLRFGNVLGSRGSVIPRFRQQIEEGGPVTVTHPEVERYFMTVHEAVQLVLESGALAENGRVYVLDMGRPVRIVDLARDLIRLYGHEPGEDIEIVFTGLRPGEKLTEEMLTTEEGTSVTRHQKIFIAQKQGPDDDVLEPLLDDLFEAAHRFDAARIRALLQILIPNHVLGKEDPGWVLSS